MSKPTNRNAPEKAETTPLPTRHVFLDTQAYRARGHDAYDGLLQRLGERVKDHKVVLHTTELTLREVERQIREDVEKKVSEAARAQRAVAKLQKRSARAGEAAPQNDADALASALFARFHAGLLSYDVVEHAAFDVPPRNVFDSYFARRPPFEGTNAKEFPDAFMIEALRSWCEANDEEMIVVTHDKAMGAAAETTDRLHWMRDIKDVLAAAAVEFDADVDKEVERLLLAQNFDGSFEQALKKAIRDVSFVYVGDGVDNGEAYDGDLSVITAVTGWIPVSLQAERATVVLNTEFEVEVEIGYTDRSEAWYDKEEDRWFGSEPATGTTYEVLTADVLTEIDRTDGTVRRASILTPELEVTAPDLYGF